MQTGVLGSRVIVADGIVNQVIHPVALPQLEPALEEGSLNFDQLDEPPARHRIGTGLPVAKVGIVERDDTVEGGARLSARHHLFVPDPHPFDLLEVDVCEHALGLLRGEGREAPSLPKQERVWHEGRQVQASAHIFGAERHGSLARQLLGRPESARGARGQHIAQQVGRRGDALRDSVGQLGLAQLGEPLKAERPADAFEFRLRVQLQARPERAGRLAVQGTFPQDGLLLLEAPLVPRVEAFVESRSAFGLRKPRERAAMEARGKLLPEGGDTGVALGIGQETLDGAVATGLVEGARARDEVRSGAHETLGAAFLEIRLGGSSGLGVELDAEHVQHAVVDDQIVERQQRGAHHVGPLVQQLARFQLYPGNREHVLVAHEQGAPTLVPHEHERARQRILPRKSGVEEALRQVERVLADEVVNDPDAIPQRLGHEGSLGLGFEIDDGEGKLADHLEALVGVPKQRVDERIEPVGLLVRENHGRTPRSRIVLINLSEQSHCTIHAIGPGCATVSTCTVSQYATDFRRRVACPDSGTHSPRVSGILRSIRTKRRRRRVP